MVDDTRYLDPSGSTLPLGLASVDRIDPAQGYEPDNVRLLCWSLNSLRMACPHDEPLVDFLSAISPEAIATVEQLIEQVRRVCRDCLAVLFRPIGSLFNASLDSLSDSRYGDCTADERHSSTSSMLS